MELAQYFKNMKKSELLQLIKEELKTVLAEINSVEDIEDKDKARADLMGELNKILNDAEMRDENSLEPSEVAKVINVLYQRYKKYL